MNHLNPRGYTLVEMVVVLAIASLTLIAVTSAIIYFYRANRVAFNAGVAIDSARNGLSLATRDIRGAAYGDDGSYPVVSIATSSFTFFADTDGNGRAEKISYALSGTNLVRTSTLSSGTPPTYAGGTQSSSTVASSVRNNPEQVSLFHFYTASSTEITTFSTTTAVAFITITLIVDVDPMNSPTNYTLRTTAALRNAANF